MSACVCVFVCLCRVAVHLPYGIDSIRQHVANIDNVPLLVHLFYHSSPRTVREMVYRPLRLVVFIALFGS